MLMKNLPAYRPQCCIAPLAVAAQHMCFFPELRSQYCKLLERYQCMVTKNKRIWALAEPKHQTGKYLTPCFCPDIGNRKVEIVRDEIPSRTRTEQLSFPPVIRLMQLKERDSFKSFSNQRKGTVNRMLRKSMLSLYSRLSNKQPPIKKEKPKKLTDAEETLRQERLKKLSKPRVDLIKEEEKKRQAAAKQEKPVKQQKLPKVPTQVTVSHPPTIRIHRHGFGLMPKSKGAGAALRRFKNLSKPKQYESDEPKEWVLTNNMKYYTPSERILKISKPRFYETFDPEEAYRVKEKALNYRATQRIKELALPPIHPHKPEVKEAPFKTNPNALKAKTSQRIVELSEPKDYVDKHTRANPYSVSPNALRAKITPRLRELAKPKTYSL